jgi:hypothetical protein
VTPNDREPDEPVRVLRDLERETKPDFLARVRNTIHRRHATAQIASWSWHTPKLVLVEMASMLDYIVRMVGGGKRR